MASKRNDKIQFIKDIYDAAQEYKNKMIGKTFMLVFNNRFIEVLCKKENFKHLTGAESSLSAKSFYENAIKHKLQASQISFTKKHPYDLAKLKIIHLKKIFNIVSDDCIMQEDITTNSANYKFGPTNLDFSLLLFNDNGTLFFPKSLRDKDCFKVSNSTYYVDFIFEKSNSEKEYSNLLFQSKNVFLPDDIMKNKISESLRNEITNNTK